jgi:hypothetical protein
MRRSAHLPQTWMEATMTRSSPNDEGGPTGNTNYAPLPARDCHWQVVSPAEQDRQAHNRIRYAELNKLRRGQPNTYEQTSYR